MSEEEILFSAVAFLELFVFAICVFCDYGISKLYHTLVLYKLRDCDLIIVHIV